MSKQDKRYDGSEIAIVGMSGRFPGARNIDQFWENIRNRIESRSVFADQDLEQAGVLPAVSGLPEYVKAGFPLEDIEQFDAEFFGITPGEAATMDPQHRLMLECACNALESAGYDTSRYEGAVGIFAGATYGSYINSNLYGNYELISKVGLRQIIYGSVPDYMITRTAYKLNLKGPSFFVQTACSTSLVAIHLGCQSLQNCESDIVLAGGVSVRVPQRAGYLYEEGGMESPDGVVRTFDAAARGTVFGNGVAMIALKRLDDALADGDTIHAVIRGTATNNDGAQKVGFTAPSVQGQAKVVAEALSAAGVGVETIGYVEAHGTGTELGDPIEIAALTRAFRSGTDKCGFCGIGSVKPNVGHLDAAAGVTSLIKAVMALKNHELPPLINFDKPNPKIPLADSPFYINTDLRRWPEGDEPRRAGVSAFGFGGANAHVILEEPPAPPPASPSRPWQLLALSARTPAALDKSAEQLANYLSEPAAAELADVAFTLHEGRRSFAQRMIVACREKSDAADALRARTTDRVQRGATSLKDRPVAFLFPGQGAQYVNMGRELYDSEPEFRRQLDRCAELAKPHLGYDLRTILYPVSGEPADEDRLRQTAAAQTALFAVESALAQLWISWGVQPAACLGHSIGEFVAACLAGVLDLPDAVRMVALRGQLMEQMPPGVMLAIQQGAEELAEALGDRLWLAASNGPALSVVSGTEADIEQFCQQLDERQIAYRQLHTSHAFHCPLMDDAVPPFVEHAKEIEFGSPSIPYLSNVTGDWATADLVGDPGYWGRHIGEPVLFSQGVKRLCDEADYVFLEVGPGQTLATLVRQHLPPASKQVCSSLPSAHQTGSDQQYALQALGSLWINGVDASWSRLYEGQSRRRVPLPTYPFERKRHWVDRVQWRAGDVQLLARLIGQAELSDWFYAPTWKRAVAAGPAQDEAAESLPSGPLLVFGAEDPRAKAMLAELRGRHGEVIEVVAGQAFEKRNASTFTARPDQREDLRMLFRELQQSQTEPAAAVYLWSLPAVNCEKGELEADAETRLYPREQQAFFRLLALAQALGDVGWSKPLRLAVVTGNVFSVLGDEHLLAEGALVSGPCRVIGQEFPHIRCQHLDLDIDEGVPPDDGKRLVDEVLGPGTDTVVAIRKRQCWLPMFEAVRLDQLSDERPASLREQGVYLITGGLGGVGLVLARDLAETVKARLVLVTRRGLPPREEWDQLLGSELDQRTRRGIQAVQSMEAAGAEVLVAAADVVDRDGMQRVVDGAVERFGRIDGVIHAAGMPGVGMIQPKQIKAAVSVLAPKVTGTRVLAEVLAGIDLDFLVLCSSLASLVGGVGQVDYCAANAFLDAFAHQHALETGRRTLAINWNAWRETGMAVETEAPKDLQDAIRSQLLANSITNRDATDALHRMLTYEGSAQIAISSQDVQTIMALANQPVDHTDAAAHDIGATVTTQTRPHLPTTFAAPRNEVEQKMCDIWQAMLGIEPVGIDDNFFELGGHSLLAVTLMSRINQALQTNIPVARLYEGLTIRFLAELVTADEQPDDQEQLEHERQSQERRDRARRQREHQQRRRAVRR